MIMNFSDEKVSGIRGISDGKVGFCESGPLAGVGQGASLDDPACIELEGV